MLSVNRSATGPLRRLLPAVALALFLALALRPGPAAALGGAPPVPPQVIDAGISHNCALAASGGADCWGTGDIDNSGPYIQVTVGELHTCALTPSGAADCWGGNNDGQATDQSGPYTQVSAGGYHTCALTPGGAVDCWGYNLDGQATDQTGPYIEVSAGGSHTCALTPSGAADCWGYNDFDQADDQTGPFTQVSAGKLHTCALTPSGAADCWGDNFYGQNADQPGPYRPYEPEEPDNTWEQFRSAGVGTFRNNYIGVAGDVDYYAFYGNQGERFVIEVEASNLGSDLDPVLTLYDADGETELAENDDAGSLDSRINFTVPAEGAYFLRVREYNHTIEGGPGYFYNLVIRSPSLYVSATTSGTTGGVASTPQDILAYDTNTGQWSMLFDGSDVAVTKPLAAFARLPGGDWLLVFKANQTTPAGTFTPWDIARFTPTLIGDATAGSFSWYIDGSDAGLTTSAEKIDALDALPNGNLLISTAGALAVPNPGGGTLKAQDEDLAIFYPESLGATTTGEWGAFFNGTAVPGMGVEDLASVHVDPVSGDILAGITGAFTIGGVSGNGKDIIRLTPSGAPGGYSAALEWRGPTAGFNRLLSGFEMD